MTGTETAVGDFGTEVLEELVDWSSGTTGAATEVLEEVIALEEGGADLELAAKETPVELTTWLQEGGADFVEEGAADLLEGGGADFELAAKETPVELTTWLQGGGADFVEELPHWDPGREHVEALQVQCAKHEALLSHLFRSPTPPGDLY